MAPGGHSISVLRAMKKIKDKSSVANDKMVACLLGCRECLGKSGFSEGSLVLCVAVYITCWMVCLVVVGCVRGGVSWLFFKWLTRW